MGKSTTAKMFAKLGCDVWDADAAVHRLYGPGGGAVASIQLAFPNAVSDGIVDRGILKQIIASRPKALKEIERIVHSLVANDRAEFQSSSNSDILVFDIPLLFETGGEAKMNAVAVVSVPSETQEKRVMERGKMTKDQFLQILEKQMPDSDKRDRADYVIITDTPEHAFQQVQTIVNQIRTKLKNA
jgi:dephospho-CoA kinase